MQKTIKRSEIDFQELYDQDLYNRYYSYKNVNYNLERTYSIKLFFGSVLLILKLSILL